MRPPLWTLLAIPILGILAWFILTGESSPTPVQEQSSTPTMHLLSCTPLGNDCKHIESTPYYNISVTYPNASPSELRLEALLLDEVNRFKADAELMLSEEEKSRLNEMGRKYELAITYKPFSGSGYTSYQFDMYLDTGGAHPNAFYKTVVFDSQGRAVGLEDILSPGYLEKISAESYAQVSAELTKRAGALTPDMEDAVRIGTSPTPETLQFFVIDGDDLVVLFPPYQVAAYAAGSFQARIPLEQLR